MKIKSYTIKGLLACSIALMAVGCKPKFKAKTPEKGIVNSDRMVFVGGGSLAGYSDGALTADGQKNSVASLLNLQLQAIGAPEIVNPMVSDVSFGIDITGTKSVSKLVYKAACDGSLGFTTARKASSGDLSIFGNIYNASNKFTNVSVPFLKSTDLNSTTYAASNPFFARLSSGPSSTVVQEATATNPTFFTLMVGEADVLTYAMKGGGTATITPQAQFNSELQTAVDALTANGAKGVVTNVPDILDYPIFTTIAWNGLVLTQEKLSEIEATAPILIALFNLQVGANAFIIDDNGTTRQMVEGEKVLFTVTGDSIKCNPKFGSQTPFQNRHILTLAEIAQIKAATEGYNSAISAVAASKGLALADICTVIGRLKTGYPQNGITMTNKFASGGAFSVDGIHMTPRGNAIIANTIIKAINATYGSSINTLDVSKYRAVIFP
jgi:hypothetical protein